jgi:hypothetical protein
MMFDSLVPPSMSVVSIQKWLDARELMAKSKSGVGRE